MAKIKIDKKALKRFQGRRPTYEQKTHELLGFANADDAPLYCLPVLIDVEIPLTIASFAFEKDFAPPINFLIYVDEHDHIIPAGRHAKLLSSYLMDAEKFDELKQLWHGLLQTRHANYLNRTGTRFQQHDYHVAIQDGVEFFIRCLAFHEIDYNYDMQLIRPILADAEIMESNLDLTP